MILKTLINEHNKLSTDNRMNIIYFTTTCNLACTYCYEHLDTAKKKHITRPELIEIADKIIEREDTDQQTFFLLYGGEVTLRWDDVEFFMDYARSKKEDVQFNMISNGIKFLDNIFVRRFINNKHYIDGKVQLDISFDGVKGNIDRIYKNGSSSTDDMLEILSKLKIINVQYRLRYTVNTNNINNFVPDVLKLIEHFSPSRVVLGEVLELFDESQLLLLEKGKDKLLQLWHSQELVTPICTRFNEFCSYCNGCSIQRDSQSLYSPDGKEINRKSRSEGLFSDFKQKANNE